MTDLQNIHAARGMINLPAGVIPRSALATAPARHLTERYEFVDSRKVIEMMTAEGFVIAGSAIRRSRPSTAVRADSEAKGLHLIDFRHPESPEMFGTQPRILFANSHDGSRAASIRVGAFRLVCSNGLVTGVTLASATVRHAGDAARELVERMRLLSRNTLPMFQQIERWTKKQLPTSRAHDFARLAGVLRWGRDGAVATDQLLEVRRAGDDAGDLWTVFNRVQEATTRVEHAAKAASGRRTVTKPLNEIGSNLKFNADLWQLAEEFSQM